MKTQTFQVSQLRGMDQRWKTKPSSASKIEDMTWDLRDGWKDAGGFRSIVQNMPPSANNPTGGNAFDGLSMVTSLHWFAQHNGARQWTVWETSDGELSAMNGSLAPSGIKDDLRDVSGNVWDGNTLKRRDISSPWQRTQSATWGDRLYLVNGYDEPIVFDGYKTERAGFSGPPNPPSATVTSNYNGAVSASDEAAGSSTSFTWAQAGMGLGSADKQCGYRYKVSFVNERGQESPLSGTSNAVVFKPFGKDDYKARGNVHVDLPTGGSEVVARRIYRTLDYLDDNGEGTDSAYAQDFYFLREIQDNTSLTFEDYLPDAVLGSLVDADDFGPWPTGAKYIAAFKNTMFVAGSKASEVLFSAPGQPEVFPVNNIFNVGAQDAGPITGLWATKNALVVFKSRGIYLIRGNPVSGFTADTLTRDVGCIAPNTLAELPGVGLAFVSHSGVYILVGALQNEGTPTKVVHLSQGIPDVIERFNRSALIGAFGCIYHRDKEYWIAVPTLGSHKNNLVLVYHYDLGEWSTREGYPINCMIETGDHRGYLMFGSHDTSSTDLTDPTNVSSGIHVYSRGWPDKNGTAISPLYETAHLDFGSVYNAVQPARIMAYAVGYGANDLKVNFTVNREDTKALVSDAQTNQLYPSDALPLYGTVTWGGGPGSAVDQWSEHRPVVLRYDISAVHKSVVSEMQVSFSPEGKRIQIVGYDLEVKTGEQRNIRPLSEALTHERR